MRYNLTIKKPVHVLSRIVEYTFNLNVKNAVVSINTTTKSNYIVVTALKLQITTFSVSLYMEDAANIGINL